VPQIRLASFEFQLHLSNSRVSGCLHFTGQQRAPRGAVLARIGSGLNLLAGMPRFVRASRHLR
jgi:hypothetical protein